MLRLTEVKLPLDHPEGDVQAAILKRLAITAGDLVAYSICRRAIDARKRSSIALIYALDVEVRDESGVVATR